MVHCLISGKEIGNDDQIVTVMGRQGHFVLAQELIKAYKDESIDQIEYNVQGSDNKFVIDFAGQKQKAKEL